MVAWERRHAADAAMSSRWPSSTERHINRYFLVQEMAAWLSFTGFTPVKWFAGFTDDETISDETWHIVAVARRV